MGNSVKTWLRLGLREKVPCRQFLPTAQYIAQLVEIVTENFQPSLSELNC